MRKLLTLLTILCLAPIAAWAQAVTPPGTAALVCAYNTSPPAITSGLFAYVQCDSAGKLITSGGGGAGTVTSVGETFTGGLISVAGSPITTAGTFALTVAGTSGGIPYFSGATTWASSAALTANALMIGGGAGAAPTTTTTGSGVLTALGLTLNGSGAISATTSPTFVTPVLGVATATSLAVGGATLGTSSLVIPAGSVVAPSLAIGNSTTGLYSASTTGLGFSVNGVDKFDYGITNSGVTSFLSHVNGYVAGTIGFGGNEFVVDANLNANTNLFAIGASATTNLVFEFIVRNAIIANSGTRIGWGSQGSASGTGAALATSFDTMLTRKAAASIQLGAADAAAPVAQTLGVQSVVAGTSNTSGQNWTVVGSLATGSGTSGDIIFKTGGSGAGATVQNTATNGLVVKGVTQAVVVSTLAGSGSRPVCVTSTGQLEEGSLAAGLVTCP